MLIFFCGTTTLLGSKSRRINKVCRSRARAHARTHARTHTQAILVTTPLDERSARRKFLTRQHTTLKRDRHFCPCGIQTHNLRNREAADLRLRPRGHRRLHLC
jgi:hypothetical protein